MAMTLSDVRHPAIEPPMRARRQAHGEARERQTAGTGGADRGLPQGEDCKHP